MNTLLVFLQTIRVWLSASAVYSWWRRGVLPPGPVCLPTSTIVFIHLPFVSSTVVVYGVELTVVPRVLIKEQPCSCRWESMQSLYFHPDANSSCRVPVTLPATIYLFPFFEFSSRLKYCKLSAL